MMSSRKLSRPALSLTQLLRKVLHTLCISDWGCTDPSRQNSRPPTISSYTSSGKHLTPQCSFRKSPPNLCAPIPSSPSNGSALALQLLTTIFNILPPNADTRYHVFLAILRVVRSSASYDVLRPQLKRLDTWIVQWDTDEEDQRKLYLQIADLAAEAGEDGESYSYLLRTLRTTSRGRCEQPGKSRFGH